MDPTHSNAWNGLQVLRCHLSGRLVGLPRNWNRTGHDDTRASQLLNDAALLESDLREIFRPAPNVQLNLSDERYHELDQRANQFLHSLEAIVNWNLVGNDSLMTCRLSGPLLSDTKILADHYPRLSALVDFLGATMPSKYHLVDGPDPLLFNLDQDNPTQGKVAMDQAVMWKMFLQNLVQEAQNFPNSDQNSIYGEAPLWKSMEKRDQGFGNRASGVVSEILNEFRRPTSRDEFEVAIICTLSIEYNAMCQLIDKFWDNEGDQFGRAVGDMNVYTTGLLGKFNVVLILLPNMGKVSATGAAASLRSSYPHLKLALVMGTCGGVPHPESGQELLLGDVVISKTVVQYDLGRQYSDVFEARDTVEDTLGRPHKSVRTLLALLETDRTLELLETRTGKFLKEIQNKAANRPSARERPRYQYPGAAQDKLFPPNYQHKHHLSAECVCKNHSQSGDPICEASRKQACDVVGCDTGRLIDRERVRLKRQQETEGDFDTAQAPSIFFGPVASGDRVVKSSIDRDIIAGRHGILAFDMEAAGVWDELPCIMVKGICNYADSHRNKDWQEFAAATAASATKALLERYIKTDRSPRPI